MRLRLIFMQNRWILNRNLASKSEVMQYRWTLNRTLASKSEAEEKIFSSDVKRISYLLFFRENFNKFPRIFWQTAPTTSLALAIKWKQMPESSRQPFYAAAKKIVAESSQKKVFRLPQKNEKKISNKKFFEQMDQNLQTVFGGEWAEDFGNAAEVYERDILTYF